MGGGLLRVVLYVSIVTLPVWLVTFLSPEAEGIVRDVALNFGLVGFMMIALQFLVAARVKWIERAFGLDMLIRYHKYVALTAAGFLILHPILLASAKGSLALFIKLDLPWYIWAGKAALVLVIVNVLISAYQGRMGLKFERWRLIHDFLAPVILVLMFLHSWIAGDDLKLLSMQFLWILMGLLAAWMFVYHRFLRPIRLRLEPYRVEAVQQEAGNVWTVKLAPPAGQTIPDYLPGQFHFLTFHREADLPVEEHHWTISSSPAQKDFISSTIKAVGDFTATIPRTRPGDTAAIHGPFGRFSHVLHPHERELVFLAGGIGITPLMAMLRYMRDIEDDRSVVLLYANRRERDIVFRKELDRMAVENRPNLAVVHVLSGAKEGWAGEKGHVDRARIEKYCGIDLNKKTFYICGPPKMAEGLMKTLFEMGVSKKQIRREIFSFLD
jgi:predicted ferric reductase